MKILYRYILTEAFSFFAISVFAFTSVLLTLRMLQFAALIVDKGVEPRQIAQVFIAIIPTFMEIAVPLATLLGVMLAFARFSGDSEMIVMRTSGVSLYQIVRPVIIFGVTATLLGLYVSHYLKPWGYQKLSRTLFEIARAKSTSGLQEGIFNKLGALTLYAEEIDDTSGDLKRVLIDDRRDKGSRKIITSRAGSIVSDEEHRAIILQLYDGFIHEIAQGGKYLLTSFSSNSVALNPDDLFDPGSHNKGKQPNEMYYGQLRQTLKYYLRLVEQAPPGPLVQIADFPESRPPWVVVEGVPRQNLERKIIRIKLEMGQRFSLPFASFALALLALPLGIQPPRTQRTWGAGLAVSLGMGVFVFYYGLFSIGLVFAQNGVLAPAVALWIPNVSSLLVALYCLKKTATEQWQSIAHGLEQVLRFLLERFHLQGVVPT